MAVVILISVLATLVHVILVIRVGISLEEVHG